MTLSSTTGWDKIQTIDSLLKKGGYKGTPTPEVRRSIRLTRYQSEKVTVAYSDYLLHCRHVHTINYSTSKRNMAYIVERSNLSPSHFTVCR